MGVGISSSIPLPTKSPSLVILLTERERERERTRSGGVITFFSLGLPVSHLFSGLLCVCVEVDESVRDKTRKSRTRREKAKRQQKALLSTEQGRHREERCSSFLVWRVESWSAFLLPHLPHHHHHHLHWHRRRWTASWEKKEKEKAPLQGELTRAITSASIIQT